MCNWGSEVQGGSQHCAGDYEMHWHPRLSISLLVAVRSDRLRELRQGQLALDLRPGIQQRLRCQADTNKRAMGGEQNGKA